VFIGCFLEIKHDIHAVCKISRGRNDSVDSVWLRWDISWPYHVGCSRLGTHGTALLSKRWLSKSMNSSPLLMLFLLGVRASTPLDVVSGHKGKPDTLAMRMGPAIKRGNATLVLSGCLLLNVCLQDLNLFRRYWVLHDSTSNTLVGKYMDSLVHSYIRSLDIFMHLCNILYQP
jgi:hypothetical protein